MYAYTQQLTSRFCVNSSSGPACLVAHSSLCGHHQDGARLSVSIKTQKTSVAEVAAEIVARNPVAAADSGLTVEMLMRNVKMDPEDASHVLGNLDWGVKGIVVLPESIDDLTIAGNLNLRNNELESLPESFGSLTVGGDLHLENNQLESLPDSFGSLTVGKTLYLNGNPVAGSLNENSFPGLRIFL